MGATRRMGLRTIGLLVLGAVLALAGVYGWWMLSGQAVRVEPRTGSATAVILRFGDDPTTTADRALLPQPVATSLDSADATPRRPRNVVLLIADGMGFAHVAAARAHLVGVDGRLFFERFPVAGWLTTHTQESIITDSAASAAAMATGFKTQYGLLARTAAGEPLRTIAEAGRDAGMAIGLVTDSYLWDATPAAFAAHTARREFGAVEQMAASGFEVLAGGVDNDLTTKTFDRVRGAFEEAGRTVVRDYEDWVEGLESPVPAVGLFAPGQVADAARAPNLADVAVAALTRLAASGTGYFLLVETEETDSGSHDWKFDQVLGGVASLEAVARAVVEYAARDGETLVVVTADHETGGLTLLGGQEGEPLKIRWATDYHSAAPVPLFAYGPGAERLAGVHDNTAIATVLADLLGLTL